MAATQSSDAPSGRRAKMSINFIAPGASAVTSRAPNVRLIPSAAQLDASLSSTRPATPPQLQFSSSLVSSQDASIPSAREPRHSNQHRSGYRDATEPPSSYSHPLSSSNLMRRTNSWDIAGNQPGYSSATIRRPDTPPSFQVLTRSYPAQVNSTIQPNGESRDDRSSSSTDVNTVRSSRNDSNATATTTNSSSLSQDSPVIQSAARQRAPRPCYSEEQKFFIMYSRIVLAQTWPAIESRFLALFGQNSTRSKGGLTSVYYRVRKEWGLEDVLQSAAADSAIHDQKVVARKAENFSREVLMEIGYLSRGRGGFERSCGDGFSGAAGPAP